MSVIPFGKMQIYLIVFHFINLVSPNFVALNISYFLLSPAYECEKVDPITNMTYMGQCTKQEVCAQQPDSFKIDWSSEYSLTNWVGALNLHCTETYTLGLFGTMFFLGFLLSLFCNPLADVFGRKIFIKMSILVSIFSLLGLIFSTSTYLTFAMMLIQGLLNPWKAMIVYSHFTEYIFGKESLYTGFLFFLYEIVIVISSMILMYVTSNTYVLIYISLAMNLLVWAMWMLIYTPESIQFQLSKGNMLSLEHDVRHVCRVNGVASDQTMQIVDLAKTYMRARLHHER